MKKVLLLIISIVVTFGMSNYCKAQNEVDFQDFWGVFYNALIKSDVNKLSQMVNFPLKCECYISDNKDISNLINFKRNFAACFLKEKLSFFKKLTKSTQPRLYLMNRKLEITIQYINAEEYDEWFEFEVIKGKYKLVKIGAAG